MTDSVHHGRIRSRFDALVAADRGAVAVADAHSGRVFTLGELSERADAIALRLAGRGIRPGDWLAVQLPNSVDFIATFLAALSLRLTMVPIDRDAREAEVATVLGAFGARGLVYRQETGDDLPGVSVRETDGTQLDCWVPLVKLTSGSTGRPKAILTSEENLIADCTSICSTMQIARTDLNLGAIPLSHSYGFSNLVMPLLLQGTPMVVTNDYLPLSILSIANGWRCTVLPGIPMMYEHLSQLPRDDGRFETVRTFISAGAPLTAGASQRFRERFGASIHTFYGCSECGGIAYDREGGAVERGVVGHPMDGVSVLLDEGSRLVVQSAAVANGYLEATAEEKSRFFDGKFRTDDLVRVTEEGHLEITGRVGELINTAGKKVNPREVERVLLQIRGVRQAKVYGEAAGARGEVVAAAIVADPDITRDQIREHCRLHLSSHKVPRIVKLIDQIPVDERGKVKRSALSLL